MAWYKETQNIHDLFNKKEDLDPDLAMYVFKERGFDCLKHPLVYSIPYMPQMNALLNAQYKFKKNRIAELESEGDYVGAIFLYERPWRIPYLNRIADKLTDEQYWQMLSHVYTDSENIWQHKKEMQKMFRSKRPGRENLMEQEERDFLSKLPNIVNVYRGCFAKNKNGSSWTLSKDKAIWFAKRFREKGALVISGQVMKQDILAYFSGRNEEEIVVPFVKVRNKVFEEV